VPERPKSGNILDDTRPILRQELYCNNTSVFLDITPCIPLKFKRRFGETCRLHFQCQRISQARNHHEAGSKENNCFAYSLTLKIDLHGRPKCRFKLYPEDINLHNKHCENLKPYTVL
jgi:hypothetical protein